MKISLVQAFGFIFKKQTMNVLSTLWQFTVLPYLPLSQNPHIAQATCAATLHGIIIGF
jgi:hypothetical protein